MIGKRGTSRTTKWRAKDPTKASLRIKKDNYKNWYGMTYANYETLLQKQNGVCAICKRAERATGKHGVVRRLSVDHCHATGIVRGLLCYHCNSALGDAFDSVEILRAAAIYLEVADTGFRAPKPKTIPVPPSPEEMLKDLENL